MTKNSTLIVTFVLAFTILLVWLPNGFQTAGIQEEWRYRAPFDGGITTYNDIGSHSSEEQFFTRPVYGLINGLTYLVTPDSFISHHIILILMLFLKGLLLYLIVCQFFPNQYLLAYFCAMLIIFYPSDTGIVSLRVAPSYHTAIVTCLLSIYIFIRYNKTNRWIFLVLTWILQFVTNLNMEISYLVYFFVPFVMFISDRKLTRRSLKLLVAFYIVPAITLAYSFIQIFVLGTSWQKTAVGSYTLRDFLRNIVNLYEANLVSAWSDLSTYIRTEASLLDLTIGLTITLVCFAGSIWYQRRSKTFEHTPMTRQSIISVIFGGFILIFLGYGIFLVSRTHVITNYRVYLLSSLGASIFFAGIGFLVWQVNRKYRAIQYIILLVMSILVGSSSIFAHRMHIYYREISDAQGQLVRQITEAVPALNAPATIVIKSPSNSIFKRINIGELQKPVLFSPMLQYVYDDYSNVQAGVMCFTEYLSCEFTPDGLDIIATNFTGIESPIPYDQIILFNITKQGELTLIETDEALENYNPMPLIKDASPPHRIQTLYGNN